VAADIAGLGHRAAGPSTIDAATSGSARRAGYRSRDGIVRLEEGIDEAQVTARRVMRCRAFVTSSIGRAVQRGPAMYRRGSNPRDRRDSQSVDVNREREVAQNTLPLTRPATNQRTIHEGAHLVLLSVLETVCMWRLLPMQNDEEVIRGSVVIPPTVARLGKSKLAEKQ